MINPSRSLAIFCCIVGYVDVSEDVGVSYGCLWFPLLWFVGVVPCLAIVYQWGYVGVFEAVGMCSGCLGLYITSLLWCGPHDNLSRKLSSLLLHRFVCLLVVL